MAYRPISAEPINTNVSPVVNTNLTQQNQSGKYRPISAEPITLPTTTKKQVKPLPSFQEWAQSQEYAPFSEALKTKGPLGTVASFVTNPAEQLVRTGLGTAWTLASAPKALQGAITGNEAPVRELLQENIPFLPGRTEEVIRRGKPSELAFEGIKQGANVVQYVAPIAKGPASLVTGGVRGLAGALGQAESTMKPTEIAKQAAIGTLAGGLTEGILSNIGTFKKVAGTKIEKVGETYGLSGWGRPNTIANFDKQFGKNATQKIIKDLNIPRSEEGVQIVENAIGNVQNQYDDIVVNSGKQIKTNDIYKNVMKRVEELRKTNITANVQKADRIQQELTNWFQTNPGFSVDVGKLTQQRKLYGDLVRNYTFDPAEKGIYQELRDIFQDTIYKGTQDIGDAKMLGKELNKLITFQEKIMIPASKVGKTVQPFNLGRLGRLLTSAQVFSSTNDPRLAVLAYILQEVMGSPSGVQLTSQALQKLGQGLQTSTGVSGAISQLPRIINPGAASTVFRRQ